LIKLKEILTEENYKFSETMRDYHSGQSYMSAFAELNGKIVAGMDYSIYDNKLYIDYLEVKPEYRRKGVATKLMDFVKEQNKDLPIIPGYASDEGYKFWKSYSKR